jgi:hypothetical protein
VTMNRLRNLCPSPALLLAMIALVLAMSGAAIAGSGKVKTNDIKNGAVTKKKLAKGSVGSPQIIGKSIKGNRLKDGAIKSEQVAADGLDSSNIADYKTFPQVRVAATDGATLAAARTAAPETELFTKGQLTVYAKCLHDTSGTGEVRGEIYIRSSADGGVLSGSGVGTGQLPNGDADLLNTTTPETDRIADFESVAAANAGSFGTGSSSAATPDGTSLRLLDTIGVKQGALAPTNGVFGDGNVCLFALDALG